MSGGDALNLGESGAAAGGDGGYARASDFCGAPAGDHVVAPGPAGPGFSLDPAVVLPAKLRNYYRHTYAQYATGENGAPCYRNSKDGRTVKRWVSAGRNCSPPDLPPLDEPQQMGAWFRRVYPKEHVPAVMVEFEEGGAVSGSSNEGTAASSAAAGGAAGSGTESKDAGSITSIALEGLEMGEGEQVRQARAIAKANYARVEEASRLGKSDDYRRWFPVWSDSLELLRKLEKEDREARKASGDLVARGPVLAEISQLIESLRIMRDGMESRIVAELEKGAAGRLRRVLQLGRAELRVAIAKVRASETAMFLNLESLDSPDAVKQSLAA